MTTSQKFYQRLATYYAAVVRVLEGGASAASVFPNSSDIGLSREFIYARFLEQHLPSACNVLLGGFLFNKQGSESKQVDVIVTTDACLQYNLTAGIGSSKSFTCVDGTLAAISLKSRLDKKELENALDNLASIPPQGIARIDPTGPAINYYNWPYKIIYAPSGNSAKNILNSVNRFYREHPLIPVGRRVDLIHVLGEYLIRYERRGPGAIDPRDPKHYVHRVFPDRPAGTGLAMAITEIQKSLTASRKIHINYAEVLERLSALTDDDLTSTEKKGTIRPKNVPGKRR